MSHVQDPYVKKLFKLLSIVAVLRLVDFIILIFTLSSGREISIFPLFPVADFLIAFLLWRNVRDLHWQFTILFIGGTHALEYFSRWASLENLTEAKYLAWCSLITIIFVAISTYKFSKIHYVRFHYRDSRNERFYKRIKFLTIASVVFFIVSNILGQ